MRFGVYLVGGEGGEGAMGRTHVYRVRVRLPGKHAGRSVLLGASRPVEAIRR